MLSPFARKLKQLNIILCWMIFFIIIGGVIWVLIKRPEGLEFKPLEMGDVEIKLIDPTLKEPPFLYEFFTSIKNPNENFIVKELAYLIEIKDEEKKIIVEKSGKTRLVENEEKRIQGELSLERKGKTFHFKLTKVK